MTTIRFSRLLGLAFTAALLAACSSDDGAGGGGSAPVTRTLIVTVNGTGTVSSNPAGISNCSTTCTAIFDDGATVQLTASAGSGWTFRAWAGSCTPGNQTTCSVLMDRDRNEVVVFDPAGAGAVGNTFALTQSGRLLSFNRSTPGTVSTNTAITGGGINAADLVGIDFRPSTTLLYGLTKDSATTAPNARLYRINENTGVATLVATLDAALEGTEFAIDFDPVTDALRVIGNTGKIYQVNPGSGVTTSADVAGELTGLAFTNSFRGTLGRTAYVVNSSSDQLAVLDLSDNSLDVVGSLGVSVPVLNGFDIDATTGIALFAFNNGSQPVLRTIDLATGSGTSANIGGAAPPLAETIRGLALKTPAEPEVFGICTDSQPAPANSAPCTAGPARTLIKFSVTNPNNYSIVGNVTGMGTNEVILAMDFRPSTGDLVALASDGAANAKLYTIDTVSALATAFRTLDRALPLDDGDVPLPASFLYGMDFDPVNTNNLRIIRGNANGDAASSVNLIVNLTDGSTTDQGALQRLPFDIDGIAFSGNNVGANTMNSTFFGLDSTNNRLFTVNRDPGQPPAQNGGRLTFRAQLTLGGSPFDVAPINGFEVISTGQPPTADFAYLTSGTASNTFLYSLNLTTGVVAQVGAGSIGSATGFTGQFVGLSAPVQANNAEFFLATTAAKPNARLISFSAGTPGTTSPEPTTLTSNRFITATSPTSGMMDGETILAMDFRFANNASTLFALARGAGNVGKIYTINTGNAVSANVGTGTLMQGPLPYVLEGTNYGMDVDPVGNSIRIVSDANENLIVDATTGGVTTNPPPDIAHTPVPDIPSIAYTQNFSGATSTSLVLFDDNGVSFNDRLMRLIEPRFVNDIGPTGIDASPGTQSALDVLGGQDGLGLLLIQIAGDAADESHSTAFKVDVGDGHAEQIGTVGKTQATQTNFDTRLQIGAAAVRFPP